MEPMPPTGSAPRAAFADRARGLLTTPLGWVRLIRLRARGDVRAEPRERDAAIAEADLRRATESVVDAVRDRRPR